MIADEDILEQSDMHILKAIKEFIMTPEVIEAQAAKSILPLLERLVRYLHNTIS